MTLEFAKMHGLGNDFVVFDGVRQSVELTPERVRALADRRFGVGCDQVLVVAPPEGPGADFAYRIHNADGGEVGQCGNGARCVAAFVRAAGLWDGDRVRMRAVGGDLVMDLGGDGRVRVDLGEPRLDGGAIPLARSGEHLAETVALPGGHWRFSAVSVGNPHAVIAVPEAEAAPVAEVGPRLEHHGLFPEGANVEFVQVLAPDRLRVRVWERGAGETLACGTGAAAALVAARLWGQAAASAEVILDGGPLTVSWPGRGHPVTLAGPAELVYWGRLPHWPGPRPASAEGGRGAPPQPGGDFDSRCQGPV